MQLINQIKRFIRPVKGILYFLFLFLCFEFIWKLCVHLGDDGEQLIVLGTNLTQYIQPLCRFDASIIYWVIHDLLGYSNYHIQDTVLFFESSVQNNLRLNIIWSCTSIKVVLMFSFIMLFYYGPWSKKIWFIPLSLIFLYLINIVRLVITAFVIKDGFPEWFIPINEAINEIRWDESKKTYWKFYSDWYHLFHDGFFRWIYYDGIMFLLWLLWEEKFNLSKKRIKN